MKLYDVIVAENKKKSVEDVQDTPPERYFEYQNRNEKRSIFKHIVIYGALLIGIAALYILGVRFVYVHIMVTERKIPFTLTGTSVDLQNESTADANRLTYQAMVVNSTITRELYGSDITIQATKATGNVIFLNSYSTSAVTIAAGTTLIGQNSKQYVTQSKVTIPGYTGTSTKKVPGSSPAVAIAATAIGDSYNSSGATLSISGYTGNKKTQLYASSVGAIGGGLNGTQNTVSSDQQNAVIASLQSQLAEKLKRETRAQIPPGFITFPDLQVISIDPKSLTIQGSGVKFPASLSGSMVTYLIPEKSFEQTIATLALSDHSYPDVFIPELADLKVIPISALSQSTTNFPDTVSVKISGQGTIITNVDPEVIKTAVLGQSKADFQKLLTAIPEIDSATDSFYPFWAPTFPKKESRISVLIQ